MKTIFLATSNPAKKEKFKWFFDSFPVELITPEDIDKKIEIIEDGDTCEENAVIKAISWSRAVDFLCVASDGGVSIPILGENWDHLLTHRFAGREATDKDRVDALLDLMKDYKDEERKIFWTEAIALAKNGKLIKSWSVDGEEGLLAATYDSSMLKEGWWMGSLWLYPRFGNKTEYELTEEEKKHKDGSWRKLKEMARDYFIQ